jgi:hypothetical protein
MNKWLHAPEIGELVISIEDTVEYIDVEGLYAPEIRVLFISTDGTAEYINVEGASCPGNRRISYCHRRYCRLYLCNRGFMPRK